LICVRLRKSAANYSNCFPFVSDSYVAITAVSTNAIAQEQKRRAQPFLVAYPTAAAYNGISPAAKSV
jgi:hypothetical protein